MADFFLPHRPRLYWNWWSPQCFNLSPPSNSLTNAKFVNIEKNKTKLIVALKEVYPECPSLGLQSSTRTFCLCRFGYHEGIPRVQRSRCPAATGALYIRQATDTLSCCRSHLAGFSSYLGPRKSCWVLSPPSRPRSLICVLFFQCFKPWHEHCGEKSRLTFYARCLPPPSSPKVSFNENGRELHQSDKIYIYIYKNQFLALNTKVNFLSKS